ncbi:MAG: hypothetical protein ACLUNJ_03475, partial [Enterocloster sp.]|uniref:hypothetical protein n=1 Tax=Enterocloster sp. TaxID=2719315 RepID=UPI003996B46F
CGSGSQTLPLFSSSYIIGQIQSPSSELVYCQKTVLFSVAIATKKYYDNKYHTIKDSRVKET